MTASGAGKAEASRERRGLTRRDALVGGAALGVGAAAGVVFARSDSAAVPATDPVTGADGPVDAHGQHQAGIARPDTPQPHMLLAVGALDGVDSAAGLAARLGAAGAAITAMTTGDDPGVAPDGAGDLSVTIGVGPRLVALADPHLPGGAELPSFAGDAGIAAGKSGGDVLVYACASNAGLLAPAIARVFDALAPATVEWQQLGFRGPSDGTVTRNPVGFHDGISVPRGSAELDENVWVASGPATGGTVCVVRQLRLDVAGFTGETTSRQEEIIGRDKQTGAPLTGGAMLDDVDLRAKTPEGELITPVRSHARAAHPSFTGSNLMLRRGYAYANGPVDAGGGQIADDQGLLFVCFQQELDDFVRTQIRMDETDDLMDYATPVASASFLILPGFDSSTPLGSTLFS